MKQNTFQLYSPSFNLLVTYVYTKWHSGDCRIENVSTIDIVGSSFMNLQSSHRYQEEEEEEGESEEKACQHNLQDRAKESSCII